MKKLLLSISLLVAGTSFAQINAGLVAHYNFNGDANDSGPNGINGVVNGATLTSDANGDANMAYEFASGTYIDLQDTANFNFGNGSFTISAWFKTDATYSYQTIVDNGTDAFLSGFTLGLNWSGTGKIFFGVGTAVFFDLPNVLAVESVNDYNDGVWHNVTVSVDKTTETMRMYIDGAAADIQLFSAFGTPGGTIAADNKSLDMTGIGYLAKSSEASTLIGASNNYQSTQRFFGSLDEIRFYNRGISTSEAAQLTDPNAVSGIADKLSTKSELSVYPNPAADAVTINVRNNESVVVDITLVNVQGEVVKQATLQNGEQVDVSQLASGMYTMLVNAGNKTFTQKLAVY